MFPIGDDNSARRSMPVVTVVLIALNVLFFFVELNGGDAFIRQWAFIPARFGQDPAGNVPTIFSAMFMHGGWLHLGGNMLYLWIFGDNVEDAFGPVKFLIFYLVCGWPRLSPSILSCRDPAFPTSAPRAPLPACSALTC